MDIVPYDQKWYPVKQVQKLMQRNLSKIWFFQKSCKQSENFYCNTDQNFCVLNDNVLGDTSLYYTQELSVTLSIGIKKLICNALMEAFIQEAYFTSNWLCSKLLVTYPDRGGQAKHFWHFLFLLSFLSQLSSAQLRDISAKFYSNNFYSPWPPLTDKTTKKFHVSPSYTSAVRSTVK